MKLKSPTLHELTPEKKSFPEKGKRFSPGMRKKIVDKAKSDSVKQAAEEFGVAGNTIYTWMSNPDRFLAGESPIDDIQPNQEGRQQMILDTWKEHPGFGPSQIRNLLRRQKGLKASIATVKTVMEDNGYVSPKMKRRERVARYEAERPRELYHFDFFHFYVHKQKQCLLFIQDDFSRFIVGFWLVEAEKADPVIECFERAVVRYGKPEGVMSDRGSAFHSWRGLSRFQKLLEEYEINFYLAKEPQANGKVEALNAAFAPSPAEIIICL